MKPPGPPRVAVRNSPTTVQPSESPKVRLSGVLGLLLTAGIALAAMAPVGHPAWAPAILTIASSAGVIACLSLLRELDRTNPLLWATIALVVMYGVHPVAVITSGAIDRPYQRIYYLSPTYAEACWMGFCGLWALILGYAIFRTFVGDLNRGGVADREVKQPSPELGSASRLVWLPLLVLAVVGVVLNATRPDLTANSSYVLFLPQLAAPAAIFRLIDEQARGRGHVVSMSIVALVVIVFAPTGSRLVLLLTIVPPVLMWMHLRNLRLGAGKFVLVVAIAMLAVLSLRDAGNTAGTTLEESTGVVTADIGGALEEFVTGPDTEMVDALAVEIAHLDGIGGGIRGVTVVAALAAPVPSSVWPGKPVTADQHLNSALFGTSFGNAGVAYGFIGELYFDSGWMGVCLGMLIFGGFVGGLSRSRWRERDLLTAALFLSLLPAVVTHLRGSLALTLGRLIYTVGPLLIVLMIVHLRQTARIAHEEMRSRIRARR